jgi:hypothetical protein
LKKLLLGLILVFGFSLCEGQSWVWARQAMPHSIHSGGDAHLDHSTAVDGSGNVYIVGEYWDTISFGSDTLKGRGGAYLGGGLYIAKYDSNGLLTWAKNTVTPGNYNGPFGESVVTNKNSDVYVTGAFLNTILFDTDTLTANGVYSTFLVKYNSNGNVLWAKQGIVPSSSSNGFSQSCAVDKFGNVYVTGNFVDTISFGSYTLITKKGNNDASVFLVKYDSSGNVIWAKQAVVASGKSWGYGQSVAADKWGNIYITGRFFDTISFGSFALISNYGAVDEDAYIVKYDSGGNVIWAKQSETPAINYYGGNSYSISVDGFGNPYITGYYENTISFSSDTLTTGNGINDFLVKYDTGGKVLWAKQGIDLTGNFWQGYSVASDTTNLGGGFLILCSYAQSNSFNLKFGTDTFSLTTSYSNSVASIILRFDSSGKVLCGSIFSEGNEDDGDGVGVDKSGKYVYFGGDIDEPVILGPDTLVYGNDIPFVARWQPCSDTNITTSTTPISNKPSISLFPNPNTGAFTIAFAGTQNFVSSTIEVYNVMGQKVFAATPSLLPQSGGGVSFSYNLNISSQPNGVYLYRVIDETGKLLGEGKFVIEK